MCYIIINDLGALPIAAALSIKSKLKKNATILLSREILHHQDYGPTDHVLVKKIKVYMLVNLFGAEVVESDSCKIGDSDYTGVMSSLYSITKDSKATREKYPYLWQDLLALNRGCMALAHELIKRKANEVYLYNGRFASCYAITKYAVNANIGINFYEYGYPKSNSELTNGYTLTSFPIHRSDRWGRELLMFYVNNSVDPSKIRSLGEDYRSSKVTNKFTKHYETNVEKEYDIAIFLSSTNEYLALNEEIFGNVVEAELDFLKKVIRDNGNHLRYAIRCHPNQAHDPSWEKTLSPLAKFCIEHGIDFYDPVSKVSSYQLIEKSKKVAVDISSIGIDAIIMGKPVEIYGNPSYKIVYEDAKQKFSCDSTALIKYLCEVMAMRAFLFQNKLSTIGRMWYVFSRIIESVAQVLVREDKLVNLDLVLAVLGTHTYLRQIGADGVVVASAGITARKLAKCFQMLGMPVRAFTDNNPQLHGSTLEGIPVVSLEDGLRMGLPCVVGSIVSGKEIKMEIHKVLESIGLAEIAVLPYPELASEFQTARSVAQPGL